MTDIQINLDPLKDMILESLRNGPCVVTFIKKNGERREMLGTLNQILIPEGALPTTPYIAEELEAQPAKASDQIRLFDIEANAWRSFTLGKFISIDPRLSGVAE